MALSRRAQRSTRLLVVSLVVASLLTISIDYREGNSGPLESIGGALFSVVGPMQDAVATVFRPIGAFFSGLAHIGSLQSENRRLRSQVEILKAENSQNVNLERQFKEAAALLDLKQRLNLQGPGANVIGQSVGNFEWTVTVDRGSSSGVKLNAPVVTGDGLVGHVIRLASCCSVVQLMIDPRSAVAGRLANTGNTGLIVGERNQDLQMQLVSPDAEVPPGEQVVTSGYQGGLYPPGILIGFVSHVYTDPASLTKVIQVRPAVDFSSLEFVLVVTGRSSA